VDQQSRTFVVCTDESGTYDAAIEKAIDRAATEGATVILYDVEAAGSAFSDPRPNEWAGEGEKFEYDHPLDPVALEKLGRHGLAMQVQKARRRGVDTYGWLPRKAGGDTLAAYAAEQRAELVLVPADLADPALTGPFEKANAIRLERV
jgi:nucleotide-binding universal stress UspA family protein